MEEARRGRRIKRQKPFELRWALLGTAELLVSLSTAVAGLCQSVCVCGLYVCMYVCV